MTDGLAHITNADQRTIIMYLYIIPSTITLGVVRAFPNHSHEAPKSRGRGEDCGETYGGQWRAAETGEHALHLQPYRYDVAIV